MIIRENDCIQVASEYFGISRSEMLGPRRDAQIVLARHVAAWLMRKHVVGATYARIGALLNRSDHTAAIHAVQKIDTMLDIGDSYASAIKGCERLLIGRSIEQYHSLYPAIAV